MKKTIRQMAGISLGLTLAVFFRPTANAAQVMISINNFAFSPPLQTINVGDTVMWMNNDTTTHTSTSGQPGVPDGERNSGFLSPGQSFSHTFALAGTFPFFCELHAFMTGSITVQGAQGVSVTITSPTNNASFPTPGDVTIEAAAASGSLITQVEFFDGVTFSRR